MQTKKTTKNKTKSAMKSMKKTGKHAKEAKAELQYRSPIMAAIHEAAEDLYSVGAINKRTMREFDKSCLTPVAPLDADAIRSLRLREGASQSVFARYLNVTTSLVSQWERGKKKPQGASLKLLQLVAKKSLDSVA